MTSVAHLTAEQVAFMADQGAVSWQVHTRRDGRLIARVMDADGEVVVSFLIDQEGQVVMSWDRQRV